jgi:cytoskeletal protein RodZ
MTTNIYQSGKFVLSVAMIASLVATQVPALAQQGAAAGQQPSQMTVHSSTPQSSPAASDLPETPQPSQPTSNQEQQPSQAPAGAAAAKAPRVQGAPASQPVGAAIAPAKQSQRRSLWIKVGLVAGAGIALGAVLALSHGSPSRPPGAQAAANHP